MPVIKTERLCLRAFAQADSLDVQRLAGDARVASTTLLIPHPYEDGMAETWIAGHEATWSDQAGMTLAITDGGDGALVGAISLHIATPHRHAEMGYWIGVPWWGRGYATEAAKAVVAYGLGELELIRVHAHHMASNPASGRVLEKAGMTHEGVLRQHICKDGRFEDIVCYGILRSDALTK